MAWQGGRNPQEIPASQGLCLVGVKGESRMTVVFLNSNDFIFAFVLSPGSKSRGSRSLAAFESILARGRPFPGAGGDQSSTSMRIRMNALDWGKAEIGPAKVR